jgi:hypothetical protein
MREFKFFKGYVDKTIMERFEELFQEYPVTTPGVNWDGITIPNWTRTNNPTWVVNPGLIQYTPNYNTLTIPNYNITTTPGTGTYTIPLSGTINTVGFSSLTTSNPNGTTITTTGFGGTLTTNTATFTSNFK